MNSEELTLEENGEPPIEEAQVGDIPLVSTSSPSQKFCFHLRQFNTLNYLLALNPHMCYISPESSRLR